MPAADLVGTIRFFRERQRMEAATTAKVLRAMEPVMLDCRPHPAASTIAAIAWTMVRCLQISNELTYSSVAQVPRNDPPQYEALVTAFESEARELNVDLFGMTQCDWEAERTVMAGSRILLQQPLGQILWLLHVDSIHHRGQLSVFLGACASSAHFLHGLPGGYQASAL